MGDRYADSLKNQVITPNSPKTMEDLSNLKMPTNEQFGISAKEAHKFVNDPEVQKLFELQQGKWDIEDRHRKAGGDINDPRFKETITHVNGLISEQKEKVVPAVKSLLGISEDTDDLNNITVSRAAFKNKDGTIQNSIRVVDKREHTYNYGKTTLSITGEVLYSDKERNEPMNKIIDAMAITFKDGNHLDTSQMEKIANTIAADHLREGEKIIISKIPDDAMTDKPTKPGDYLFSVSGVRTPSGYETLPLCSVGSEGGNIRVSTSYYGTPNYFKERGLKD